MREVQAIEELKLVLGVVCDLESRQGIQVRDTESRTDSVERFGTNPLAGSRESTDGEKGDTAHIDN